MVWSRRRKSVYTVCPLQGFGVDVRLVSQDYEPANLRVSVTGDQDGVYEDQVLALSGEGPMKPTLLLIGKRLGHDNVNPLYYRSLKVPPAPGLR
jgi:hypothetical protein